MKRVFEASRSMFDEEKYFFVFQDFISHINYSYSDEKDDDGNDYYPYPYIFRPPAPPGDIPPAGQSQAKPSYY